MYGRSPLVVNDATFRLRIREEGLDLEAAQVARQRASARYVDSQSFMSADGRHNTPIESADSKCLTSLGESAVRRSNYREKSSGTFGAGSGWLAAVDYRSNAP